jgi:hypothetical protein
VTRNTLPRCQGSWLRMFTHAYVLCMGRSRSLSGHTRPLKDRSDGRRYSSPEDGQELARCSQKAFRAPLTIAERVVETMAETGCGERSGAACDVRSWGHFDAGARHDDESIANGGSCARKLFLFRNYFLSHTATSGSQTLRLPNSPTLRLPNSPTPKL